VFQRYGDLPAKAAALMYRLSKSQACTDGNKRIALILVDAFVRLNGCRLYVRPGELADKILEVADSSASDHDEVVRGLTSWLRTRLVRVEERSG
jgi:prophage maintenance system killer protein